MKDNRELVSKAAQSLEDFSGEPGEHTASIYNRLVRCVELEIEAEWADYLKCFRVEQDRGDGQIAAAWPDEET